MTRREFYHARLDRLGSSPEERRERYEILRALTNKFPILDEPAPFHWSVLGSPDDEA